MAGKKKLSPGTHMVTLKGGARRKVQVLKSGKWKFLKGGGGGGRRRPSPKSPSRRSSGSSVSTRSNPGPRKAPGIGSMYQAGKGTQAVLAPVIQTASTRPMPKDLVSLRAALSDLRKQAGLPYLASLAVEGASQALDVKFQHATALTKGSVTAWAAEIYALVLGILDARSTAVPRDKVRAMNERLSQVYRAYSPLSRSIRVTPEFWIYHGSKVGGGLARRLSNRGPFRKILAGPKRLLKALQVRA